MHDKDLECLSLKKGSKAEKKHVLVFFVLLLVKWDNIFMLFYFLLLCKVIGSSELLDHLFCFGS